MQKIIIVNEENSTKMFIFRIQCRPYNPVRKRGNGFKKLYSGNINIGKEGMVYEERERESYFQDYNILGG